MLLWGVNLYFTEVTTATCEYLHFYFTSFRFSDGREDECQIMRFISMQREAEPTCFYLHPHTAVGLLPSTVTTAFTWGLIFEAVWPDWMCVKWNLEHPPVSLLRLFVLNVSELLSVSKALSHVTSHHRKEQMTVFPPPDTEARQRAKGGETTQMYDIMTVSGRVSITGGVRPRFNSVDTTGSVLQTRTAPTQVKITEQSARSPKNFY